MDNLRKKNQLYFIQIRKKENQKFLVQKRLCIQQQNKLKKYIEYLCTLFIKLQFSAQQSLQQQIVISKKEFKQTKIDLDLKILKQFFQVVDKNSLDLQYEQQSQILQVILFIVSKVKKSQINFLLQENLLQVKIFVRLLKHNIKKQQPQLNQQLILDIISRIVKENLIGKQFIINEMILRTINQQFQNKTLNEKLLHSYVKLIKNFYCQQPFHCFEEMNLYSELMFKYYLNVKLQQKQKFNNLQFINVLIFQCDDEQDLLDLIDQENFFDFFEKILQDKNLEDEFHVMILESISNLFRFKSLSFYQNLQQREIKIIDYFLRFLYLHDTMKQKLILDALLNLMLTGQIYILEFIANEQFKKFLIKNLQNKYMCKKIIKIYVYFSQNIDQNFVFNFFFQNRQTVQYIFDIIFQNKSEKYLKLALQFFVNLLQIGENFMYVNDELQNRIAKNLIEDDIIENLLDYSKETNENIYQEILNIIKGYFPEINQNNQIKKIIKTSQIKIKNENYQRICHIWTGIFATQGLIANGWIIPFQSQTV